MSYRRLFSCLSSHCKDEPDNNAIISDSNGKLSPTAGVDPQQSPGSSGIRTSTRRRKRRDRCPNCRGFLPDQKQQQQRPANLSANPQPVLIPMRIRKSALAELKEDSGCYEQLQSAKTEPPQHFEDSGFGVSSCSQSPGLPQPQQPMPKKPPAVSSSSSSSDILFAQLSEQTKWVPRLPNRQAPFDAESQRRFLAAKQQALSGEMSRTRNLKVGKK